MHIPDGWLSLQVSILTWIIALIVIALSLYKLKDIEDNKIVYMGIIAAIVFEAQMIKFPLIVGPVTGHLLGAALATLIVGPWAAILVLTAVLIIQALFFADGGILVLGANILNMGIIGAFTTEIIKKSFMKIKSNEKMFFITGFTTSLISVLLASAGATVALILSDQFPDPVLGLTTVLLWHFLIGIGEGIITAGILVFLWKIEFPLDNLVQNDALSANQQFSGE